jgi:hypothetical protein
MWLEECPSWREASSDVVASEMSVATVLRKVWGCHPLIAGVLADLPPSPLDVDDLVPGAVAGREDGVVLIRCRELSALAEQLGREPGQDHGAPAGVRLRRGLPIGALSGSRSLIVPDTVRIGRSPSRSRSPQRKARTSPMRHPVARIRSMMSAMSPVALGPGRSVLTHRRTAARISVRSLTRSALASFFGRWTRVVPRAGFVGIASYRTATREHCPEDDLGLALPVYAVIAQTAAGADPANPWWPRGASTHQRWAATGCPAPGGSR